MNTDWTNFLNDDDFHTTVDELENQPIIYTYPVVDSTISNSRIEYCSTFQSTIDDSHLYFDPDYRLDDIDFFINQSTIQKSEVTNSSIQDSNISDCFVENSTITDSTLQSCVVQNSTILDSVIMNQMIADETIKSASSSPLPEGKGKPIKKEKSSEKSEKKRKYDEDIGGADTPRKKSKHAQMQLSLDFFKKDASPVELSTLVCMSEIISSLEDYNFPVHTEKGSSTFGDTMDHLRCLELEDSTYIFHSVDLFAPYTFYNSNIARYSNKLILNSQYFVYTKTNVRFITVEGAIIMIHHFKHNANKKGESSKLRYLELLEGCLYKLSDKLCNKSYDSPITITKEKRIKQRGWDDYFNELSEYIADKKQTRLYFPPGSTKYTYLLNWCTNQKYHRKRGVLTSSKMKRLESLKGFHWGSYSDPKSPHSKTKWMEMFERLKTYLKSINHQPLYFERGDTDNKKLIKWCQAQKTSIKRKRITEKRYEMLRDLPGFHFGTYTLREKQVIREEHPELLYGQ